ncbi:hypothetical protein O181_002223 [Austropuccinia psidii MF-1]|uniref:Paired domain-containing protein n=1 Tax=Austropuccinia psidii MF-1 TaxID=1389203 RepID=A0A9Q3BCB7_9BASI|nr:hypothetical protein [Austropuccinia psidii MF-1]
MEPNSLLKPRRIIRLVVPVAWSSYRLDKPAVSGWDFNTSSSYRPSYHQSLIRLQMPPQLDHQTRGSIVSMSKAGMSIRIISDKTGVPSSTVHDTIRKYRERGTVNSLPRPGRPRKLNDSDMRHLSQVVRQSNREPLKKIKSSLMADVSTRTIQRAMRQVEKQSSTTSNAPNLTQTD